MAATIFDGSIDIRERERIAGEIARTSESTRKKHQVLKTANIEKDIALERNFKLIMELLQYIIDNSVSCRTSRRVTLVKRYGIPRQRGNNQASRSKANTFDRKHRVDRIDRNVKECTARAKQG